MLLYKKHKSKRTTKFKVIFPSDLNSFHHEYFCYQWKNSILFVLCHISIYHQMHLQRYNAPHTTVEANHHLRNCFVCLLIITQEVMTVKMVQYMPMSLNALQF